MFDNYILTNVKTQSRDESGICDFNSCLTWSSGSLKEGPQFSERPFKHRKNRVTIPKKSVQVCGKE